MKTHSHWLNYSSAAILTAALAVTLPLAAPAANAQTGEDGVDEIIVTARRTNETLIETPVSVAAFGEAQIETLGMRSIDDIARHTAGFSFSQAFGRTTERPVIRGAANILAGVQFGVESGTAYFVDGVYYSGDMQALDLRNLDRVEVIKGAQSALYGRNTYAGAINFVTRRPTQNENSRTFEVLGAEDGEVEYYGNISHTIDDVIGFSLSGRHYSYDGDDKWINADGGEQLGSEKTTSFTGVLDVQPNDNVTVIARAGFSADDDGPRPFRLIGAEQNNCYPGYRSGANYSRTYLSFGPWGRIFNGVTTPEDNSTNQYFCGSLSDFEDLAPAQTLTAGPYFGVSRELIFGTLLAKYNFDSGYLASGSFGLRKEELQTGADSNHLEGETGPGPFPTNENPYVFPISPFFSIGQPDGVFYNAGRNTSDDYSAEFRISSPADRPFRWSVGAFAYDSTEDIASISFANQGQALGPKVDQRRVENQAIFATVDFDINEKMTASLELRQQRETKGLTDDNYNPATGQITAGYENSVTYEDFVPKAILSYDFDNGASGYLSYAKGIKPGGVNGPIGVPTGDEFYAPEESDAFELGYKTRLPDGNGQVTVAAFFNDIKNYQLTTPVAVAGSTSINSVATNQGSAEIYGLEVEGTYNLTDELTVGGSYAYTDAEFTEGCDDFQFTLNSGGFLIAPFDRTNPPTNGLIRNPTGGAGLTAPVADPQGFFTGNLSCSIAGNRIPMTSEHQFSLFGNFERPISDMWGFYANADYTYEGSKFVQVHNGIETGETGILGGNMGLQKDNLKLELFARNLLDERTPPIGTRWFDLQEGFNSISSRAPGAGSIDRNVTGPRSVFLSYRRGRQIGARIKVDF